MAGFGVVLDACVLVPVSLADTLLRIAAHARPGWHLGCHTSGTNSVIPEG